LTFWAKLLVGRTEEGGCHECSSANGPLTLTLSCKGRGNLYSKGRVKYLTRLYKP